MWSNRLVVVVGCESRGTFFAMAIYLGRNNDIPFLSYPHCIPWLSMLLTSIRSAILD